MGKKQRAIRVWLYLVIICACTRPTAVPAQTSDDIQRQCMEWLAQFTKYAQSIFVDDGVNQRGDSIGHFREQNADVAMIVSFVHEYGQEAGTELPAGTSYDCLRRMAMKALRGEIGEKGGNVWSLALTEEFLNFNLEKYDEQEVAQKVEAIIKGNNGRIKASDYACAWSMMPMNSQASTWKSMMNELLRRGSETGARWHEATRIVEEQAKCIIAQCLLGSKKPDAATRQLLTEHWRNVWQRAVSPMVMPDGEWALTTQRFSELTTYAAMATLMQDADALMLEERLISKLTQEKPATTQKKQQKGHANDDRAQHLIRLSNLLMTTWLLHEYYGDWASPASSWNDFTQRNMGVRVLNELSTVRSLTKDRFAYLTWKDMDEPPVIALGSDEPATEWVAYQGRKQPYCIWATPGNALITIGDVADFDFYICAAQEKPGTNTMELDPRIIGKQKKKSKMKRREAHVYFSGITEERAKRLVSTTFDMSRDGWTIILCDDTDGKRYLLAFNTTGTSTPFQLPKELRKEEKDIIKKIIEP